MLAAEWGTGQVFWSMLWFFMFVIWILCLGKEEDRIRVLKVLDWIIFIIFKV